MKKMLLYLLILTACVGISVSKVLGKDGFIPKPTTQIREDLATPSSDMQIKIRERELEKREKRVQNTASNSAEALKNFQMKTIEAKKQRLDCLKEKATEIKTLEMQRATGSASLTSCSAKNIQSTLPRPAKPNLDGLADVDKQAATLAFQSSMKEWTTQMQAAAKTCRANVQSAQLAIREQIITIKEACSATERTVLGLSTDVPYNAQD